MRTLSIVDWVVVGLYLLLVMTAGVVLTRRAGRSVEDFFVGGPDRRCGHGMAGAEVGALQSPGEPDLTS